MRSYLTNLLFAIIFFFFYACNDNSDKGSEDKGTNIILIMADDLGYGDISCYGSDFIHTPVLDKLAEEGMRFTDFHSNGSVCSPTRAALLTGNYQQRAGLEGVIYAALDKRIYGIEDRQVTVAEAFQNGGYATGIFGKWHLGYKPEFNPTLHGFDEFYGYVSGNVDYISHRDGVGLYDWWHNADTAHEEGYVTDLITDFALKFIDRNKEKPFFLYIPHEAPHYPYQGRNDKADRLPDVKFQAHGSRTDKKQAYKEMVEIMDENIGRIIEKLEQTGLIDNTFIFFCSDNGATKLGSNGVLNGYKGSLWEGGHRVPAIAWYPRKIKPQGINHELILSMDVFPSLLQVAGIENSYKLDGRDFTASLFNGKGMDDRTVFWRYRNQKVARRDNWKYLEIEGEKYLFNIENDLPEQNNLLKKESNIGDKLQAEMAAWEKKMDQYPQQTN